jgi:hypothetical protein
MLNPPFNQSPSGANPPLYPSCLALAAALLCLCLPPAARAADTYVGMCDASAAAALDDAHFAAASDEDNRIHIFRNTAPGLPLRSIDLGAFLELDRKSPEMDLEAATRVGEEVYWISSHARDKDGGLRPNRHRFFATQIRNTAQGLTLEPLGRPYRGLLQDLVAAPGLREIDFRSASQLAPKEPGALNIEALCPGPDGSLYIGFRNPLRQGRAIVVPLRNPEQVVQGQQRPDLGPPILLDLRGMGLRDLQRVGQRYCLVASGTGGGGRTELLWWDGSATDPVRWRPASLKGLNPEALVVYPGTVTRLQLLSDDSSRKIDGLPCKDVKDPGKRAFRSVWLPIPLP